MGTPFPPEGPDASDAPDAPVWFDADAANGWASGWAAGYRAAMVDMAAKRKRPQPILLPAQPPAILIDLENGDTSWRIS